MVRDDLDRYGYLPPLGVIEMPPRPGPAEAAEIVDLARQGISLARLSGRFNRSQKSIQRLLALHGVKPVGVRALRQQMGLTRSRVAEQEEA